MHESCRGNIGSFSPLNSMVLYMLQVGAKNSGSKIKNIFKHCTPPHPSLLACVVVPAKDEGGTIVKTLNALRKQLFKDGSKLSSSIYEVILLANNCTDDTFKKAKNFALKYPGFNLHVVEAIFTKKQSNIGYVRRILMDEACYRLNLNGIQNGIIASTDGDTKVDKYWLGNIIAEIANGNDAVGGRILTDDIDPKARLYYLRDITYRILMAKAAAKIDREDNNPWPCHHQYFGASLAVTCGMYDYCGRLPGVPHLEDMALYNALIKVDAKIRCSPAVKVYTSGRTDGRVAIGFSEQLKKWALFNTNNIPQIVEPAASILIKFKCKRILRKCFEIHQSGNNIPTLLTRIIASNLAIDQQWLCDKIASSSYFGALWQDTEEAVCAGYFYENYPGVDITEAISELRVFFNAP